MMGYSHAISGAAAWLTVGQVLDVDPAVTMGGAAVAAVAALLPDLDHPNARLARAIPLGGMLARGIAVVAGGHRRGTHTLAAALGVTLLVLGGLMAWGVQDAGWWTASVGVGYVAHLVGDCLTPGGCPLLLPFSRRRHSVALFRTGGTVENLLVAPALGIVAAWQAGIVLGLA